MSESCVWTTDVLSSSVWSCYSDSTLWWHKATFLGAVLLLCDLVAPSQSLLQYLTMCLYDVSCCEYDQICLRSCGDSDLLTWGLWREPKVVWCGPNVVFSEAYPLPIPLPLPLPPLLLHSHTQHKPVKFLLLLKQEKKRKRDECLRRCQRSGELEPLVRNSERTRVIICKKNLLRRNTVRVVHFLM